MHDDEPPLPTGTVRNQIPVEGTYPPAPRHYQCKVREVRMGCASDETIRRLQKGLFGLFIKTQLRITKRLESRWAVWNSIPDAR